MIQRRSALFCVLVALVGCLVGPAAGFASPFDFTRLTGKAAVDSFLRAHAGEMYEDAVLGDFRLVDLDDGGKPALVATVDYSGRRFFNHLLVLRDDGGRLSAQDIEVWNMESLDGAIQDLDEDGRHEILVRQELTPYLGAQPLAVWTAVFRFDGDRWTDQSARFPRFYDERVLPDLERRLVVPKVDDESNVHEKDVLTIERDKILRVLGRSSAAGLDSALQWARSADPVRRVLSISVLSEIGGLAADSALQALAADRDTGVAAHALVVNDLRQMRRATP
jgi:hypothetical protein